MKTNRRDFLVSAAALAGAALAGFPARAQLATGNIPAPGSVSGPVPSLTANGSGGRFIWLGDCTSGIPGARHETNFRAVNALLHAFDPAPEHVVFLGDDIMGYSSDAEETRAQWRHFLDNEYTFGKTGIPSWHMPSNHNTANAVAESVFREVFPHFPKNGPAKQEGLSYHVRHGDILYVVVNTAFSGLGGDGHVETDWLDEVLTENADAPIKFVAGHHPAFPVNNYLNLGAVDPAGFIEPAMVAAGQPGLNPYFRWHIVPSHAKGFWDVLVRHGVTAYLCSHIIVYDVQVHEGVLQVCTAGAGTNWGPDGFMPGSTEYYHAVQGAVDADGLRYNVVDTSGAVREWLTWPLRLSDSAGWEAFPDRTMPALPKPAGWDERPAVQHALAFRLEGRLGWGEGPQTLVAGWDDQEGGHILWVGLDGPDHQVEVHLIPVAGQGARVWRGPRLGSGGLLDATLLIHTGMGPGGVMIRNGADGRWTSLVTSGATGAERMAWPVRWAAGHAISGADLMPFRGTDLRVRWTAERIDGPVA